MVLTQSPQKHIFYHADRDASLKEGQEIILDGSGLSKFGSVYWPVIQAMQVKDMNSAQQREYYLEYIKREPRYSLYSSRLQSIFGANTIDEAIVFANSIVPRPNHPIPIFEILSNRFWTLDSNWLDFIPGPDRMTNYYDYWDGKISNHNPIEGGRRPPRLEVLIALPATVGKIAHVVDLRVGL